MESEPESNDARHPNPLVVVGLLALLVIAFSGMVWLHLAERKAILANLNDQRRSQWQVVTDRPIDLRIQNPPGNTADSQ